MEFNIENYLNSLQSDIEIIDISRRNLNYIPDLSRFTKLKILNCENNKLRCLPKLPNSIQVLNCSLNYIEVLPELHNSLLELSCQHNLIKNIDKLPEKLEKLVCNDLELEKLPDLPENLQTLICSFNELTEIPYLPKSIIIFNCNYNKLQILPILPDSLQILKYQYNPIEGLLGKTNTIKKINDITRCLEKLKLLIYCIKYQKKFRNWLWYTVRKPQMIKKYHPSNLQKIIDEKQFDCNSNEFHKFLTNW
jgi:hypothetical protein